MKYFIFKQSTRKEIIKRVHQDQQQQRKLHDEKMKRMQAKFHVSISVIFVTIEII